MIFPITPPDEAVQHWVAQVWHEGTPVRVAASDLHIAKQASQWGWDQRGAANEAELQQRADQELEACREWTRHDSSPEDAASLRAARRPKAPSEADLALAKLTPLEELAQAMGHSPDGDIRRALERLKELEGQP